MKYLLRVLGLAVMLCVMPRVFAADLTGTWKGTFAFQGDDVPTTLHLTMSGVAVTGTVEGLPTSPVDIHDGKVDGDAITFWVNTDYQGETYKLIWKGTVKGDTIDFSFGTDDGSWGTSITVKRDASATTPAAAAPAAGPAATTPAAAPAATAPAAAPAVTTPAVVDVTGSWKGDWDLMGRTVTSTIALKSDGAIVTGTVQSGKQKPEDIHDGKVEGDTVTFWINSEYQGQTYVLQYKGKISGGQISFDFGVSDGSWGSSVVAKKV